MKVGDKLRCIISVDNYLGKKLFIKDNIYEVLYIASMNIGADEIVGVVSRKSVITLDHILYANEYYNDWSLEFVNKHFINIREERKNKLDKINES